MGAVINKDGKINKLYAKKLWNYVSNANIDSFNKYINRREMNARVSKFNEMLNVLILLSNKHNMTSIKETK